MFLLFFPTFRLARRCGYFLLPYLIHQDPFNRFIEVVCISSLLATPLAWVFFPVRVVFTSASIIADVRERAKDDGVDYRVL